MATRPRMAGTIKAKLALDPASFKQHKAELKGLERAARKEAIEEALLAGGEIIHSAAQSRAPGKIELRIIGGRTLRKKVDPRMMQVVKANGKFAAIGPDAKHWFYRFAEFGATPHDIAPVKRRALKFENGVLAGSASASGGVRMRPFLRPAVDNKGEAAVKAMGDVLAREISKALKG